MAFLIPPVVNIFVVCKDDGHIETIACVTLIAEAFTVFVKTLSSFEISACGGAKKGGKLGHKKDNQTWHAACKSLCSAAASCKGKARSRFWTSFGQSPLITACPARFPGPVPEVGGDESREGG